MKFSCEIIIDAPIDHVAKVFLNPDSLKHFQDGFISKQLIFGTEGKVGATSKLVYKNLELKETILLNNLPTKFKGLYEHKHMTNTMTVLFNAISSHKTQYISQIEYTKFNGLLIKLMASLFPGMFRKQVYKWMKQFKSYVESLEV
nr:SRPBCC family protein [uncultured Psychroserpens sp.]